MKTALETADMLTHVLYFFAGATLTAIYFRARIRALTRRLNTQANALQEAIKREREQP